MKSFFARVAYWWTLGWDTSEVYSGAREKQAERESRLKRRIGESAFAKFDGGDSGALKDPAFFGAMVLNRMVLLPSESLCT